MSGASLYFHLRDEGVVLANRRRGRAAAVRLRENADEGQDIVLDFAGVEVITPSFAQELLDTLQAILAEDSDSGRLVVVVDAVDDVLDTLALVLDRRSGTLAYRDGDRVALLSSNAPHLLDVLERAQKLKRFTAPELAESLEMQTNAVNNRLRPLLAAGVVGRTRDPHASRGVRYIYRVVTADQPALAGAEPVPA